MKRNLSTIFLSLIMALAFLLTACNGKPTDTGSKSNGGNDSQEYTSNTNNGNTDNPASDNGNVPTSNNGDNTSTGGSTSSQGCNTSSENGNTMSSDNVNTSSENGNTSSDNVNTSSDDGGNSSTPGTSSGTTDGTISRDPVFDPIINADGTRDFSKGEKLSTEGKNWAGIANSSTNAVGNSTTFTYATRAIGDVLVGSADESLSLPFTQITANTKDCEYVYSMKVKANNKFTFILFADKNTKETYTSRDIVNGVAKKMGVYFTFSNGKIEVKASLGNGTAQHKAKSDVCLNSVDGSLLLDGKTENNLKITLTRYAFDNIMIQIYINDKIVMFSKVVPENNEDVYGLSLRSQWSGGAHGDGFSVGVTDVNKNSPFIRVSRGLSDTEGLGKGLAIIPSNTSTAYVTISDFSVIKM